MPILYHGTSTKNLKSICQRGLQKATRETCSAISREFGHVEDCVGNVSLAKRQKDAVFFAFASAGMENPQAIIELDASKLDKFLMFHRDLFGVKDAEVKYLENIPPSAIKRILIREFIENGKLRVKETYHTCEEFR